MVYSPKANTVSEKKSKTSDAIAHFINQTVLKKECTVSHFFWTLAKCVTHSVLFEKLARYNFDSSSLNLLKSYFSNRYQKVFVNGQWPDEALVEVGVPQGSILGPLLILIFVNNFFEFVDPVEHILWADDSNITVKSKDLEQVKGLECD